LSYTALRDTILTHPTLVEGLIPLFSSAPSRPRSADAKADRGETAKAGKTKSQ